jgi:hypothetical protein
MSDRIRLVSSEVNKLIEATKGSRNAARDHCFLFLADQGADILLYSSRCC